jgi:predicted amidohydrolase YtcJ
MSPPRPDLVVIGQVVVAAEAGQLETAEAVGIADGRVSLVGTRREVVESAASGARAVDMGRAAVVPGLHDFHLHLVGMARARRELALDGIASRRVLVDRVQAALAEREQASWLRGRGWSEAALDAEAIQSLNEVARDRLVLLYSHDAHSAWASPAALRLAAIGPDAADPAGGRLERGPGGAPNGVLRERATDLAEAVAGRLRGGELHAALEEVLVELAGWGITAATDAGDTTSGHGVGVWGPLGDRASLLLDAAGRLDGRLRLTINLPADAISAAAQFGLRTGAGIAGTGTLRAGWAKVYLDGALGSQTAAVFTPYTGDGHSDTGILRLSSEALERIVADGRSRRIGVAVHAIGDRAAASILDALDRAGPRPPGMPPDRIEHLQLVRPADRPRLARVDATASLQPVHAVSDRDLVERCWADRMADAYPLRALVEAGARVAFGSDAPIESANPWHGVLAAVLRRGAEDPRPGWATGQALDLPNALAGYTCGPAIATGLSDEGHLRPGARADLAVLDVDLETLRTADERLAGIRSMLTLVGGHEVHRS